MLQNALSVHNNIFVFNYILKCIHFWWTYQHTLLWTQNRNHVFKSVVTIYSICVLAWWHQTPACCCLVFGFWLCGCGCCFCATKQPSRVRDVPTSIRECANKYQHVLDVRKWTVQTQRYANETGVRVASARRARRHTIAAQIFRQQRCVFAKHMHLLAIPPAWMFISCLLCGCSPAYLSTRNETHVQKCGSWSTDDRKLCSNSYQG